MLKFKNSAEFIRIGKNLLHLALPMGLTQFIAVGSGFICMAMVATLGRNVLAASALIFSARISILIMGASLLFSLGILIGRMLGEGNHSRIGNFMQQAWLTALLISLPLMLIFWHIPNILSFTGQSKPLVAIVRIFFHANIWNVTPFLLSVCNQQLLYATRNQRIDLIANVLGVLVLLITCFLLIFGKLGIPKLGVSGFAYALNLQGWFYFGFTTLIISYHHYFKKFILFKWQIGEGWRHFWQMLTIGWPISFQICSEMFSFLVSTTMVGWLGLNSLAAYQVTIQYIILLLIPIFALSQASGILISHTAGEKKFAEIKILGKVSLAITFIITSMVAGLFLLFPEKLASLYLHTQDAKNPTIIHLIILLFAISAATQLFDGFRNVLTGMLRGLFDTRFPMYVGILSIWLLGIPLGYFLAFTLHLGVIGISLGYAGGMMIGALILIKRWRKHVQGF
jgi:MATE family multidrug resistance protein